VEGMHGFANEETYHWSNFIRNWGGGRQDEPLAKSFVPVQIRRVLRGYENEIPSIYDGVKLPWMNDPYWAKQFGNFIGIPAKKD